MSYKNSKLPVLTLEDSQWWNVTKYTYLDDGEEGILFAPNSWLPIWGPLNQRAWVFRKQHPHDPHDPHEREKFLIRSTENVVSEEMNVFSRYYFLSLTSKSQLLVAHRANALL